MFESVADARRKLRDHGFDAPEIEVLVQGLMPTFVFEALRGEAVLGGTRFGGTPDLPPGTAWPRPPAPDDPEVIAGRGNEDAGAHMREHMARGLPYTFLAQVDLAETVSPDVPGAALPTEGRLLFFYDIAVGPWETGTRPARVLWDRAPRETLVRAAMPPDLAEAVAREQAEVAAMQAKYGGSSESDHEEGTTYGAPARAMRLRPTLRPPNDFTVEIDALPGIDALYEGEGASEKFEHFWGLYGGLIANQFGARWQGALRQQLLGSPHAEQDDPRYDAVVTSHFGVQHLESEAWGEHRDWIIAQASEWRLLLQVALGDWMQAKFVEGTVYFVIRATDLAERRFENTIAVYQQT